MEISKKYEAAIIDFFNHHIKTFHKNNSSIKAELVLDKEHQRYILVRIGWDKERFIYAPLFHFDIIKEKVWLQHNATEILIDKELMNRGIPKKDMIIGFKPAYVGEYAGFGLA